VFVTGGEPFVLDEIYAIVAYASARVNATVLTNAMLLRGKRLASGAFPKKGLRQVQATSCPR
jgi:molybdenum cofactor biosynthesis enzyme MoaA